MLLDYNEALKEKILPPRKCMVKKGTLDIDIVEAMELAFEDEFRV